jgi:hypothetical protein
MTAPKFLKIFTDRFDSSAKVLVLVSVTAVLTVTAIMMSADFMHERRINKLRDEAQKYTAALQSKIKNDEEHLQSIAALGDANNFVGFGQRAKRLMEENPSYINLELRDESGTLISRRSSATLTEVEPSSLKEQLPPSILLSFLRANEKQSVFWAHSYSPSGKYSAEMIVPSRNHQFLWLARVDPNYWIPPQSGIAFDPAMRITLSEQADPNLNDDTSVSIPLDLPGSKAYLLFSYAAPVSYTHLRAHETG